MSEASEDVGRGVLNPMILETSCSFCVKGAVALDPHSVNLSE